MKNIIRIFRKDAKIATRDMMLIYIIIIPIICAIGILLFDPSIEDSSINLAILETAPLEYRQYMETYAKVEVFKDLKALERRVLKRDDIAGVIMEGDSFKIILEGNEDPALEYGAKVLNSQYKLGSTRENTTAMISSFNKTVPPLKTLLTNTLILLIIMLSGMIIAIGIIEEKTDNTISAINVTPVSQNDFILGKSLLGGIVAIVSVIISVIILGYYDVNWIMILLVCFTTMILSMVIGFLQGIASEDVIEAASGVKMLMVPIIAAIAVFELVSDKWQWTMYWNPFYWSYKANNMILAGKALWSEVLLYSGLVFAISMVIYFLGMPKIRKGLSK